jgi:hypothetical protein
MSYLVSQSPQTSGYEPYVRNFNPHRKASPPLLPIPTRCRIIDHINLRDGHLISLREKV